VCLKFELSWRFSGGVDDSSLEEILKKAKCSYFETFKLQEINDGLIGEIFLDSEIGRILSSL
jgi:hypothetical protein